MQQTEHNTNVGKVYFDKICHDLSNSEVSDLKLLKKKNHFKRLPGLQSKQIKQCLLVYILVNLVTMINYCLCIKPKVYFKFYTNIRAVFLQYWGCTYQHVSDVIPIKTQHSIHQLFWIVEKYRVRVCVQCAWCQFCRCSKKNWACICGPLLHNWKRHWRDRIPATLV